MTKIYIYILICLLTLSACSTEETTPTTVPDIDLTWEEEELPGPSATVKGFECGDITTRSSWEFNGQKMVFGWEKGDALGLYPTAGTPKDNDNENKFINHETKEHPLYAQDESTLHINPELAQSTPYYVLNPVKNSQTQALHGGSGDFEWDNLTRWTAYKPYNPSFTPLAQPPIKFTALPFDFSNQTQMGLTDMQALYQGKGGQPKGYNNPFYLETEAKACKHLATCDFAISPEMVWNNERINFEFRHVGAIARLLMLAPDENLTLEKLELICDSKIFHTKGKVDLTSHVYDASKTNKGMKLVGDEEPIQMKATDEATQKVTLNFATTTPLQLKKTTSENKYSNYLVAYIMLYPIEYEAETDGNLFAYVTAKDDHGKEVHFVSEPLSDRNLRSGYYYQWTLRTHPDDGLYPIELTATLLPWQDIVGAGINTDLEK